MSLRKSALFGAMALTVAFAATEGQRRRIAFTPVNTAVPLYQSTPLRFKLLS